jgi:hypothetical protein
MEYHEKERKFKRQVDPLIYFYGFTHILSLNFLNQDNGTIDAEPLEIPAYGSETKT